MHRLRLLLALSLLVTIIAPALADDLYLQDGSVIHGKILTPEYGKRYVIQVDGGQTLEFSGDQVARFTYGAAQPATPALYAPRRSPALSVVLGWLIPTAGHAYAGRWGRGLGWLAGEVACFAVITEGARHTEYGYYSGEQLTSKGERLVGLGVLGLIGFRVAELVDAYQLTQEYNRRQLGGGVVMAQPPPAAAPVQETDSYARVGGPSLRPPPSRSSRYAGYGAGLGAAAGSGAALARGGRSDLLTWGIVGATGGALAGGMLGMGTGGAGAEVGVVPVAGGGMVAVVWEWR